MVYRKGEHPLETLLNELCVDMGFCLPPDAQARMLNMPTDAVDEFVNAVFLAVSVPREVARRRDHDDRLRRVVATSFAP